MCPKTSGWVPVNNYAETAKPCPRMLSDEPFSAPLTRFGSPRIDMQKHNGLLVRPLFFLRTYLYTIKRPEGEPVACYQSKD